MKNYFITFSIIPSDRFPLKHLSKALEKLQKRGECSANIHNNFSSFEPVSDVQAS